MKILVTGANGFVGQNLCVALGAIKAGFDSREDHVLCANHEEIEIYKYDIENTDEELDYFCANCDFVFNLAGVNRPKDNSEFMKGNFGFASKLLQILKKHKNNCPVMLSSSIQATLQGRYVGSEYGKSKKAGEDLFFQYGKETGAEILVYRFQNIFGKWCRPNYNSAIATFCNNIANSLEITVNDPNVEMDIVYIDDLVEEMIQALRKRPNKGENGYCTVPIHYETTLGTIAELIRSFPLMQESLRVPNLENELEKKLYSTYLSYLPAEKCIYDLKTSSDFRGGFTEIIKTADRGQFSVNISKPGITKGNHWHHTKNEKFVVVSGEGLIQTRRIGLQPDGNQYPLHEFYVSGNKLQVIEMIPGYTHNIINLSNTENLVTFMWANEVFDSLKPDTFFEKV